MLIKPCILRSLQTSCRKTVLRNFKTKTSVVKNSPDKEIPSRFKLLMKPVGFTVLIGGVSFCGTNIWDYETQLKKYKDRSLPYKPEVYKAGSIRQRVNTFWRSLSGGEKIVYSLIAINAAVFIMWRIAPTQIMTKWFLASPQRDARCWPMLLSTFSHYSPLHIFFNMYVLYSFSQAATWMLGREQFLNFYLSAGVVSCLASYIYKISRTNVTASLGASGAIMALIGLVGIKQPESRLSVALISEIYPHSFSAKHGIMALITFDTLGILLGWNRFDHAAHLGGMLFGIWYASYGEKMMLRRRLAFVKLWHKMRVPRS